MSLGSLGLPERGLRVLQKKLQHEGFPQVRAEKRPLQGVACCFGGWEDWWGRLLSSAYLLEWQVLACWECSWGWQEGAEG